MPEVDTVEAEEVGIELPAVPDYLSNLPCRCNDPNCTIPYGICHCGCGQLTPVWSQTDPRADRTEGEHALIMNGHFQREDGSRSLPFRKGPKRVMEKPYDQLDPRHQKVVLRDFERACVLYEAFAQYADKRNLVAVSAERALEDSGKVRDFPGKYNLYAARTAGTFLTKMGATKPHGPARRFLIKHPILCRPELAELLTRPSAQTPPEPPVERPQRPTPAPVPAPAPTSGVLNTYEIHVPATIIVLVEAENVRSITDEQVAEAVAVRSGPNLLTDVGAWDVAGRRD